MNDDEEARPVVRFLAAPFGAGLVRLLLLGLLLVGWQYASGTLFNAFWLPLPSDIFADLRDWVLGGSLWPQLLATALAMVSGYLLGCATGIVAGLVLGRLPFLTRVLSPYLTAFYSVPKIALAPLFVIVFGIGLASKIVLVAVVAFFVLLYATLDGVRDVDEDFARSVALMGASRRELFLKLLLPATIPWILTGMRVALPNALTAVVLGELIAANRGIGYLISYYSGQYDSAGVYAAVIVLLLCSVAIAALLNRFDRSASRR